MHWVTKTYFSWSTYTKGVCTMYTGLLVDITLFCHFKTNANYNTVKYCWHNLSQCMLYSCIGNSSTLYPWQCIMLQALLDRETEKYLKAPVFPLVCVSNLHAERKAVLGNRRSRVPFKGWRRGLKSHWLPGSSPPKEPQRYLQEQQRWRSGRRFWAEADTITHPLEGDNAALQRSHLNGSPLSRHEKRC